jgi:hypothetical protein
MAGIQFRTFDAPDQVRPIERGSMEMIEVDGVRAWRLVFEPGWRFTDPELHSNPIPGNHGHPVTDPIPFLIAGGDSVVRAGATVSTRVHPTDVAPTVGALFGLDAPAGGYDGSVLDEALN